MELCAMLSMLHGSATVQQGYLLLLWLLLRCWRELSQVKFIHILFKIGFVGKILYTYSMFNVAVGAGVQVCRRGIFSSGSSYSYI